MSTPYVKLIVGCEIPDEALDEYLENHNDAFTLRELRLLCQNGQPEGEAGFHCTYDQHTDFLWFGVCCKTYKSGFSQVEDPAQTPFKAAHNAWLQLPDDVRRLLGRLKTQLLVGID